MKSGIFFLLLAVLPAAAQDEQSFAPRPEERQLPKAMRSEMAQRPVIRVGADAGDIIGKDNRALQAAVDYIGALGGGTVEIGPGVYLMRDSLHLRSHVTVRGQGDKTVLLKAPAASSRLAIDGDFGEEQITVTDAAGFEVGDGVAVWDARAGGFHTTVARIIGRTGNILALSRPLNADCIARRDAQAATVFAVVSGVDIEDARVENLVVDGARDKNVSLNGCRGAGIYFYRAFGSSIVNCTVRGYHGDGISFQQSNDVQVIACRVEDNAALGLHPGSGSQRPVVRDCVARNNGTDGLYLCWRVRHGLFENNQLIGNGRYGISIGHKDSDNQLRKNIVRANAAHGIYFRNEPEGIAGHRNVLEANQIEDNGRKPGMAGIMIDGETHGTVIRGNTIRDTRQGEARTQRTAIRIGSKAGAVIIQDNHADTEVEDLRARQTSVR